MQTVSHYGIIAVKYSDGVRHHHNITHFFIIKFFTDGKHSSPGVVYNKTEALALVAGTTPVFTMVWSYTHNSWAQGSKVRAVRENNGAHLRSSPDNTETDNLAKLLIYTHFVQ